MSTLTRRLPRFARTLSAKWRCPTQNNNLFGKVPLLWLFFFFPRRPAAFLFTLTHCVRRRLSIHTG